MCKIVFLDAFTTNPGDVDFSPIERLGHLVQYERMSDEKLKQSAGDADIVITNKYFLSNHNMDSLPCVKHICVAATGVNNVNLELMKQLRISVSNAAGYSTASAVQQTFAFILAVLNQPEHYFKRVRSGIWSECADFCFYEKPIQELASMTVGIVGYGSIGKALVKVFKAFGSRVLINTRSPMEDSDLIFCDLDTILTNSDVLSLNVPLTSDTKEFINRDTLIKMKDTAILVNTGRGGLINESELLVHLREYPKFTIILDVVNQEPPVHEFYSELFSQPNCFVTPHLAWAGREARQRLINIIAENIESFLKGGPILNQVV